ncbi:MAG: amidohydrolase [Ruminococcaceae bacterium]|nr:amidohydrolase [Oscillospiraceae bacterium]
MIIDFHTHIFPDKIAKPTVEKLKSYLCDAGEECAAYTDGTLTSLLSSMEEAGVDKSVILPVVTNPKQFESINRFAAELKDTDGIISFGGIHPDNENVEEKLDFIKSMGLKGIKLHPDYQNTYVNDEKYIRIIRYAEKIGLITVIHAGYDVLSPDDIHCTPDMALDMLSKVSDGKETKIVLAHLGGLRAGKECLEKLAGKNIYLDVSYVLNKTEPDLLIEIFEKHGYDKILFASDSPWGDQKTFRETLDNLDISKENKNKIFCENALHLLALNL